MRKLLLIFFIFIFNDFFAQTKKDSLYPDIKPDFVTKKSTVTKAGHTHTYQGKMNLTLEQLQIKGAKKITHDTKTNKIVVYDFKSYNSIRLSEQGNKPGTNRLEYTIGDTIIYFK